MIYLLCLICFVAGFVAGRLRKSEPVRRIQVQEILEPGFDREPERLEDN